MQKIKLAIFISGKGTNAIKLIDFFEDHPEVTVNLLVSNNPNSPCLSFFHERAIPVSICNNIQASDPDYLLNVCKTNGIDVIVLAGYLRKIPMKLISYFHDRIVNIHPSLLPKYGGAGMYGDHVHNAVLSAKEQRSGITIHLVNEEYDRGRILAQFECSLSEKENLESLKQKISKLEYDNYGPVITNFILGNYE